MNQKGGSTITVCPSSRYGKGRTKVKAVAGSKGKVVQAGRGM